MKKTFNLTKTKILLVCAAIVLAAIAILSYFVFFNQNQNQIKIASTTDVINYFDNNGITEYFNDKLDIEIDWVDYGNNNDYETLKKNLAKDSEELPDAYLGFSLVNDEFDELADQLFLDIANFIDDKSQLGKIINEDAQRAIQIKNSGGIYSFPSFYQEYSSEYPQKVWINQKWLDAVNEDVPTTTDEFYDVLMKFKNDDPNGNDEKDEMPLGVAYSGGNYSTFGFLVNAYITCDYDLSDTQGYLNVDSKGKVYSAVTDKKYKDSLKFIKKLMDKKLVSKDVFETSVNELIEGSASTEKYGVIVAEDINAIFNDSSRAENYVPLSPLEKDNVATIVRTTDVKTNGLMVAKYSKNVDKIIELGNQMLTKEGTLTVLFGKEGVAWAKSDEDAKSIGSGKAVWKLTDKSFDNTAVKGLVPYWFSEELQMSEQKTSDNEQLTSSWQAYLNTVTKGVYARVGEANKKNVYPQISFTEKQEAKLVDGDKDIREEVYKYLVESSRDFVFGDKDFDKDWDKYVDKINEKGLETIIEVSQEAYDKYIS